MKPVYLIRVYRKVPGLQISQPMGILYLAAYLRKQAPVNLKLLDMRLDRLKPADVVSMMRQDPPSMVGMSALSYEAPIVHELAGRLKAEFPEVPIVVGGPYSTTSPELVVKDPNIDVTVVGEGEVTFAHLVDSLLGGVTRPEIHGTVTSRDGQVVRFPDRGYLQDIDGLPFPAWDLLDIRRYFGRNNFNRIYARKENMTVMTSRGCPFRCAYCHNVFGLRFRARSPENVIEEIHQLYDRYGVRELLIIDDTFNLNRVRAKRICDLIMENKFDLSISFPNGLKADVMDEELIEKLKQCGTYRICYGVESANSRILELIDRKMDLAKTKEVIARTAAASILTHGFFMLGFPTETEQEMRETIAFSYDSRLHSASFFVVVPFPGTRLFKMVEESGHGSYIDGYFRAIDNVISAVPREKIRRLIKEAYRGFYANPWRLYHIARLTPKNLDFLRSTWEFLARAS